MWWTERDSDALGYAEVHLILEFKLMGLEIGGSFAGTFCQDIYQTYIYIVSFPFCLLFVLLVLSFCSECVSASAYAERLLCGPTFVSKLVCPLCYILPADTSTLHQLLWSYDNSQHRCNIRRKIVSQQCDRREARRLTDRLKTRAPAESMTRIHQC